MDLRKIGKLRLVFSIIALVSYLIAGAVFFITEKGKLPCRSYIPEYLAQLVAFIFILTASIRCVKSDTVSRFYPIISTLLVVFTIPVIALCSERFAMLRFSPIRGILLLKDHSIYRVAAWVLLISLAVAAIAMLAMLFLRKRESIVAVSALALYYAVVLAITVVTSIISVISGTFTTLDIVFTSLSFVFALASVILFCVDMPEKKKATNYSNVL